MARYEALSKSTHLNSGVLVRDFSFALNQAVVPLVAEELSHALPTMVAAFVSRPGDEGGYDLVALQSLEPGKNVFVHTNGRWLAGYRPAWYRAHPFLLSKDKNSGRNVVCIDTESEAYLEDVSKPEYRLFDDEGNPSEQLSRIMEFLEKLEQNRIRTRLLIDQLDRAGLVTPWNLKVRNGDDEQAVQGLFHINEVALRELEPDTAVKLIRSGALTLAYSQLLSQHRLQALGRLYELRREAEKQGKPSDADVDVEALFADDDDDNLTF